MEQYNGPWRLNAGDEHSVMTFDNRRLVSVPCGGMSSYTFAEAAEIARLIAAAPDLLAALVRAPIPGRGEEMMAFRDRQDQWIRGFYAPAIAKATSTEGGGA